MWTILKPYSTLTCCQKKMSPRQRCGVLKTVQNALKNFLNIYLFVVQVMPIKSAKIEFHMQPYYADRWVREEEREAEGGGERGRERKGGSERERRESERE